MGLEENEKGASIWLRDERRNRVAPEELKDELEEIYSRIGKRFVEN